MPARSLAFTLFRLLSDGEFHSGEVLARQLGISRASVNNILRDAGEYGLTLYRVRGRGYRLSAPLHWLDAAAIARHLGKLRQHFGIEILDSATSSNTLLLQRAAEGAPSGSVLAVEWQSQGRGRLGRVWHAGLGDALTFSLLWRFERGLSALSGLSLAAGVAVMRALAELGIVGASLKWPNDLITARGKLAGILVEAQGDMLGPSAVVIGIGINLSGAAARKVDQPLSALADLTNVAPERNVLLATLLRALYEVLQQFAASGFAALQAEWQRCHGLQDQPVHLLMPDGSKISGIARGVAEDGALLLETPQGVRRFNAGEISLRSGA
jgi:BirA family biotin operon repressor/biotin-[acetyl-CoA-carboxylase] ligase